MQVCVRFNIFKRLECGNKEQISGESQEDSLDQLSVCSYLLHVVIRNEFVLNSTHSKQAGNIFLFDISGEGSPLGPTKSSMLPGQLPPNSYFGSHLGLLHFQQQLQQQALNSSLFQRAPGAMPLPYQSPLSASSLLGGTTGLPPTSMATGPWSPYFLFARQSQSGSSGAIGSSESSSAGSGMPVHLHNRGIPAAVPPSSTGNMSSTNPHHKELILNSSIESLRMRARQHSASLGLMDG